MILVSSDSAFHGNFYVKHERIICHEAAEHRAKNGSSKTLPEIWSFDMTLEIRSQVKGHSRYGLKILREDVKLFKG